MKLPRALTFLIALAMFAGSLHAAEPSRNTSEDPALTERFTIDRLFRDRFLAAIRKYADEQAFAIRIAPSDPSGEHLLIQLWREDVKIIGVNPFKPEEFRISFYRNCGEPLPEAQVSALAESLRLALAKISTINQVQ
jgi:hypothetical protein